MEESPPRRWMDEADEIAPGRAVLDRGNGALSTGRPDAAQEGLEANAMLIRRPQFHGGMWQRGGDLTPQRPLFF
jgi:hypothetical protein